MFNCKSSLFFDVQKLAVISSIAVPIAAKLDASVLLSEAFGELHQCASDGNYDPNSRMAIVVDSNSLLGWTRFDYIATGDSGTVRGVTSAFVDGQLLSGEVTVLRLLEKFATEPLNVYFVLDGGTISGSIRYTDLFSPSFQLSLLALSLALEEATLFRLLKIPQKSLSVLSNGRVDLARKVKAIRYPDRKEDCSTMIRCTTFIDKGTMVARLGLLESRSKSDIQGLFGKIERIRNICAHPGANSEEWLLFSDPKNLFSVISEAQNVVKCLS